MILYTTFIFLLCFFAFRFIKPLRIQDTNPWFTSLAFTIKVIIGFYFLYIYTEVYGKGTLSADAGAFMTESGLLNEIFYESPSDYFKLLTGIGNDQTIILKYLNETSHWDSGAQTIIQDNRNILRFHSLVHFFSFSFSAIHVIVMCFISTVGLKQLILGLQHRTLLNKTFLFFIFLLTPSLLFWTSGILKEPIMFLGLSILIRGLFGKDTRNQKIGFFFLGAILLFCFKPYVLIAILPALLFYIIYRLLSKYKIIGGLAFLMICVIGTIYIFPSQSERIIHVFSRKQFDFKNVGKGGLHAANDSSFYFFEPEEMTKLRIGKDSVEVVDEVDAFIIKHGSIEKPKTVRLYPNQKKMIIHFMNPRSDGYIELTMINNSMKQMIINIPEAVINSLFRPFINDPGSWLKYPAVLETLLLFSFLFYSLLRRRTLQNNEKGIVVSIVIFVITLSLIIGWVTPVLGAIVRYRIPVYLGILIISLIIIKPSMKYTRHE